MTEAKTIAGVGAPGLVGAVAPTSGLGGASAPGCSVGVLGEYLLAMALAQLQKI